MCGICGIVSSDRESQILIRDLIAMRDSMVHRGPDDAGYYLKPGIALGTRRLAILDLSDRAHMPMSTSDGRFWITYNGEVYNYKELRSSLEARGYTFRSHSDTEVVLNLFVDQGPNVLEKLNGMFAFAIWDQAERLLFLARDRLGVKPLYYAIWESKFYFASEEKALFAAGLKPQFDAETWTELLCFRYVSGERTPYVGVKRLLPGHYLIWKDGRIQTRRWWNLGERTAEVENPQEPAAWFRETFDSAVSLRRISDVPVGVLLSGGLDSGSVAASLSQQAGGGTAGFTVRFKEPRYDEGPLAQQVARLWNLKHHELVVSPDELLNRLQYASWLNDEPLVHGNDLHLLAISTYAKQFVTVLLSGEGGDETLGGYVRYQPLRFPGIINATRSFIPRLTSVFNLNGRLRKLARFMELGSIKKFVFFNSCEVLPGDLSSLGMTPSLHLEFRQKVLDEAEALYPHDPVRQAMYYDQHTFLCSILDRNDRMTMGASIECRVPFLDYRLVEGLAALPKHAVMAGNQSKYILRKALGERLPEIVLKHRKWGFAVPWSNYLRQVPSLRSFVIELPELDPIRYGPFERVKLRKVVEGFLAGDNGNDELIRQLIMIAIWYEACIKSEAPSSYSQQDGKPSSSSLVTAPI